jgi:hypothetical protein
MENTYIKLYRGLMDWEWYSDSKMVHLFIHLLLKANHSNGCWQGNNILRGQLITGLKSLEKETNISQQSLRTCLNKLIKTKEITIKATNKFSVITILKYDSYQSFELSTNKQTNKQTTNKQQTTNIQSTTNNNVNNNKEKEINISFDIFWNLYDKKIDLEKSKDKWVKLTNEERLKIIDFIPKYKIYQPDKKFRKNPTTFFNNKTWNDEIILDKSKEEKKVYSINNY